MPEHSIAKTLFGGGVASNGMVRYPDINQAEAAQVHSFIDNLRRFAARSIDSARFDRESSLPERVLSELKTEGFFGLALPRSCGGQGFRTTTYARAIAEVASVDASVALTVDAHASLGAMAVARFAKDDVASEWLPKLASGATVAAFAFAEMKAGSDAASLHTHAARDGDSYVLSGEKAWVTNAAHADAFVVFARTSPDDDHAKPRLTAFIVARGQGVEVGPNQDKLGVRAVSNAHVTFDRVRIPNHHVLGEVGRGFKVALDVLSRARLSLSAMCLGIGKRCLRLSVERASDRRAFGRSIGEFGLIRDKVASIVMNLFALESMTFLTTGLVDGGLADFAIESAICKVFASETLWTVANEAQQIAGAAGYLGHHEWQQLLRDSRFPMAFEGTNEVLRSFIALSGMQDPNHVKQPNTRASQTSAWGLSSLGQFAARKAREALTRERPSAAPPLIAREVSILEQYTELFAKHVDSAMARHGKSISEMQFTQKRIANAAIELYAASAVVSRTARAIERHGEEGSRREVDLTHLFVRGAQERLAATLQSFHSNDDELRKSVAQRMYADGAYPLDVLS